MGGDRDSDSDSNSDRHSDSDGDSEYRSHIRDSGTNLVLVNLSLARVLSCARVMVWAA